jgi:hypothetical protein
MLMVVWSLKEGQTGKIQAFKLQKTNCGISTQTAGVQVPLMGRQI